MVAWKENLAMRQTEISNKSINKLIIWLEDFYSTISKESIESFTAVYNQMLSTLGENKKSIPEDLYKLDAYWDLQKNIKEALQIAGEEIYSQLNSQLKIMYVDIYEGIAPKGNERPCPVSEEEIEELINLGWGPDQKSTQEKIWISITILWNNLFGDLMYCVIKNLSLDDLEKRLQNDFINSKKSLDTLFADTITHIQGYAAMRRYEDDKAASVDELSYLGPYIETYGNEEEVEAYSTISTAFTLRPMSDEDDSDENFGDEDGDGEISKQELGIEPMEHVRTWSFMVEMDGNTCNACMDLSSVAWKEHIYGPPPLPIHPHCRCSAMPDDKDLSAFADAAESIADSGAQSIGEFLGKAALIAAFITLGVMVGDDYSSPMTEEEWLKKWSRKFHIENNYGPHNPWLVEMYGSEAWEYLKL